MHEQAKADLKSLQNILNPHFTSAVLSGLLIGLFFHPTDRALYLRNVEALTDRQRFLSPRYWSHPFSGLRNTLYQRMIGSTVYFTLQGELQDRFFGGKFTVFLPEALLPSLIGLIAGTATGIVSNPLNVVKFYIISNNPHGKPLESALELYKHGAFRPFFKGIVSGVARDCTFGVFYESFNAILCASLPFKNGKNPASDLQYFFSHFIAAALATSLSSPWNYVRNMQFTSKPSEQAPKIKEVISDLFDEAKGSVRQEDTLSRKSLSTFSFFRKKLMIGTGTLRAAGGMALSQSLFKEIHARLIESKEVETGTYNTNQ